MQLVLSKIFMFIIYALQIIPVMWAYDKLLEPRFSRKLSYMITLLVYAVVVSVHLTITHFSPDLGSAGYIIYDCLRFLVTAGGLAAAYKGNPLKMLSTFVIIFYGCPTLASAITSVFIPYGENAKLLQDYPILATVMCIFLWLLTPIAVFFLQRISTHTMPKQMWVCIVFPVTQVLSSMIISDMLVFVPEDRHEIKVISFFITMLGVVADIIIMLMIVKITEQEEARKKLETEAYMVKSEQAYYEHINEKLTAAMKIRHDIKNVLIAAENLVSDKDGREDGCKLVEMLKNSYKENEPRYFCEHKVINAVLYDKSEKAAENGISINVDACVPENISVDCFDLCRVFSNLLDNAAESAIQTEEKKIDFKCSIKKGYLYIESVNSCRPTKNRKRFLTSKKDKTNHGFGLSIIKEISDRYNGESRFTADGNQFMCKVWLKV